MYIQAFGNERCFFPRNDQRFQAKFSFLVLLFPVPCLKICDVYCV